MKRTAYIAYLTCGLILALPTLAVAAEPIEDTFTHQAIDATIGKDWSVLARWTEPANTAETDIFIFPEYKDFGFMGAFSYTLTSASNENGPVSFSHEAGDYAYVNSGYPSGRFTRKLYLDYAFKPPFKSPLVIYEFPIFTGGFFRNPKLAVNYPESLTLLSAWPPPTKTNPVEISYGTDSSYAPHAVLIFKPNPLPPGIVMRKEGRFTIAGDAPTVEKVVRAARSLGELDDVVSLFLGTPLPQEVIVMIGDLDATHLNFEASGLAVPPNLVLLNKQLLALENDTDTALLLSHEAAHLSEMSMGLFKGSEYIAPWFREGLATLIENEMRTRLLKTHEQRVQYDLLGSYGGHLFTTAELKNKYTQKFEYFLSDDSYFSSFYTYTHGALVLRHVYDAKGASGMKQLLASLKNADSNQYCTFCDSDTIVNAIQKDNGWSNDEVLYPFKGDTHFEDKVAGFVQERRTEAEEDAVLIPYITKKIPRYFTETGVNLHPDVKTPAVENVVPPTPAPEVAPSASSTIKTTPQKPAQNMPSSKTPPSVPAKKGTTLPSKSASLASSTPAKKAEVKKPSTVERLKSLFRKRL